MNSGLRGHQIEPRSECPAPLAPFLGGEGQGVRGERSLGFGSSRPFGERDNCKERPVINYPSPPTSPPQKGGEGRKDDATSPLVVFRRMDALGRPSVSDDRGRSSYGLGLNTTR